MTKKAKADSDKAFDAAMSVWHKHRYAEGEKLLGQFAAKYPNSRWRAEAELHQGCYLTYLGATEKAKPIFQKLDSEFAGTNISVKARIRLGNIAEREAQTDEAIRQYTSVLKMNPTWDQFKYANSHARKLLMTRRGLQARINCGPVALAACLGALGKQSEATKARDVKPDTDGLSLSALESLCATYNVPAKSVEMTLAELHKAKLPVLAYVEPKHFIAVLGIKDGKVQIEDSIRGKYESPFDELGRIWSGKVLTFAPKDDMRSLTEVASLETVGGCCGQAYEDECLGCPGDCQEGSSSGGGFGNGGSGGGGGGMSLMSGSVHGCPTCGGGFGGGMGGGGGGNGGSGCCSASPGRPSWKVNTNTMNLLVTDTPVWYDTGVGYNIAFTLNYSNENSNTGIFGCGWRSVYDMKVFFLPSGDLDHPTLQVHRDSGRIETYEWQYDSVTLSYKYLPRSSTANFGYRDAVELTNGVVILSLRGGGKYYFMPERGTAEGRIHIIEDAAGNRVTCGYDSNGCLATVTDASGGITDIVATGIGINERVTNIRIPRWENGAWVRWSQTDPLSRQAVLGYNTDGNLTSITDMLGDTSNLSYNAMLYTGQTSAWATTWQDITTTSPANGEAIPVLGSTDAFFPSGKIKINNNEEITYTGKTTTSFTSITRGSNPAAAPGGSMIVQAVPTTTLPSAITETSPANGGILSVASTASFPDSGWIAVVGVSGSETLRYTGKTTDSFTGITRGTPAYAAAANSSVYLCSQAPYLSEIVTPSRKTKFTYEWWTYMLADTNIVALHEVFECGRTEDYPATPSIHYAWCSWEQEHTYVTRYPASVTAGASGCDSSSAHWTGGLTTVQVTFGVGDSLGAIVDELGNTIAQYGYNNKRDRTSVTDAGGHTTQYFYTQDKNTYYGDGKHDMYYRRDALDNEWAYTYNADHTVHTETDAYGRLVKTYTYDPPGKVHQIDMPLGIYVTNTYDTAGRLSISTDGRGKTTQYHYDEDGETRGLLTSVHDPDGKVTSYHYDTYGRKDRVTDPSGNITRYEYDNLDRVTKTIYGLGTSDPYTETKYTCCHKVYDQDENGRRTYYVYDAKVRPYKTITSAASTTLATSITPDSPTDNGNLSVADASGLSASGGDVVVLDEIIHYTGISSNQLTGITRGYYNTRRVGVYFGFPVGRVDTVQATYGYHPQYLDWTTSLTDALGHTTYYEYYANHKLKTIRYPDDKGERYTYDGNNSGPNMIKKEYGTFTGTYPNQTFTANDSLTVNYEYDADNRLLKTYH